nr:hypothetical protein [uncultured Sphingobacterium sp.]
MSLLGGDVYFLMFDFGQFSFAIEHSFPLSHWFIAHHATGKAMTKATNTNF